MEVYGVVKKFNNKLIVFEKDTYAINGTECLDRRKNLVFNGRAYLKKGDFIIAYTNHDRSKAYKIDKIEMDEIVGTYVNE